VTVGSLFGSSYRLLPGKSGITKGVLVGPLVWLIMGFLFFPLLGLGVFAWRVGLGVQPALFPLAMALTYSTVMGAVYAALNAKSRLPSEKLVPHSGEFSNMRCREDCAY
jgi:hypothetical protein